jgi:hypothetical protein
MAGSAARIAIPLEFVSKITDQWAAHFRTNILCGCFRTISQCLGNGILANWLLLLGHNPRR